MHLSSIIEAEELLKIYKHSDVMIFDVSNSSHAKTNYEHAHLEGALFIDLNTQLAEIKNDFANGGRHPLPPIESFAQTLTDLGVTKDNHIIIYDDKYGSNAAARFWWMLKSVGHEKVQVLNGGLSYARKIHFPMSSKIEIQKKTSEPYLIDRWHLPIIAIREVEKASNDSDWLVVDVRDKDRYDGKIEPIDVIAGHIPGAINIPFTENIDQEGLMLKADVLRKKYTTIFGSIKSEKIIIHCGSGVTACHTLLALDYAGLALPYLYVGSWSEWSRNNKALEKTNSLYK